MALLQGDQLPSILTGQSSTPEWYNQLAQKTGQQAMSYANTPYTTYQGPRVAGFNPDQTQAFDIARGNVGAWRPYAGQAGDLYTSSTQQFPEAVDQYMSPYVSGVSDEIMRLGTRNLMENIIPNLNSTFTGLGQFGSQRNFDFTNNAVRDATRDIAGQQALALNQAYKQAGDQFSSDMARRQTAAGGLSSLGQGVQNMGQADVANLYGVGSTQQGQTQKNLDLAYQDFLEQRDWPAKMAQFTSGIAGTIKPPSTSQQWTAGGYAPSDLANILGMGTTLGSMSGTPFYQSLTGGLSSLGDLFGFGSTGTSSSGLMDMTGFYTDPWASYSSPLGGISNLGDYSTGDNLLSLLGW